MSTRTPFLSALVLISSAFPAQALRIGLVTAAARAAAGGAATGAAARVRRWAATLAYPGLFALVALLAWYVAPATGVLAVPGRWWYAVALAAGALAPGIEVAVGYLAAWLRRRRVARVALHERWAGVSSVALVAVTVTAVAEEVVFRGVGLHLLRTELGWPAVPAVGLTALVYGLNHLYYGGLTVLQKIVTGVLLGVLYELCGQAVVVPLLAHVTQNLVVLLVLPRIAGRRNRGVARRDAA